MSDFLQIDNFNIKQLDSDGKEVLDEFEQRFEDLRKRQCYMPPEFYKTATDFHTDSCRAQIEVKRATMRHFTEQFFLDKKLGCELDAIKNWQTRRAVKKAFIQEQRRLKKPLPWRYDFWGNLLRSIQGFIVMFIPSQIVRLFTRKSTVTIAPKPPQPPQEAPQAPAHKQLPTDTKDQSTVARKPASADIDPVGNIPTDKTKQPPAPATLTATGAVSRHSLIKEQKK